MTIIISSGGNISILSKFLSCFGGSYIITKEMKLGRPAQLFQLVVGNQNLCLPHPHHWKTLMKLKPTKIKLYKLRQGIKRPTITVNVLSVTRLDQTGTTVPSLYRSLNWRMFINCCPRLKYHFYLE